MAKKGEITSTQIAFAILAILGFLALSFVLYNVYNNDSLTNRDLCRLSILSRATVPTAAEDAVPLNCFTEKVCITTKKSFLSGKAIFGNKESDCKQFAGEENVRNVEVSTRDLGEQQKALKTIQGEVANAMYDCWIMAGQGKMDIFTKDYAPDAGALERLAQDVLDTTDLSIAKVQPSCLVCSRVAFSDSLLEENKKSNFLSGIDYNNYMFNTEIPGTGLTYWRAFTDKSVGTGYGTISGSEALSQYFGVTELSDENFTKIIGILEMQFKNQPVELDKVRALKKPQLVAYLKDLSKPTASDQIAIVFTQIKVSNETANKQYWSTFSSGFLVGGAAALSGPGKIVSFLIPGPGLVKFIGKFALVGAASSYLASNAEATTTANQALAAATCGKFQSTISNQQGCSILKLVNWDVNTLNSFCSRIEGNL